MKKNIFLAIAFIFSLGIHAQGEMDAIRMSTTELQGTARGQAMGGAFGALGGDITGIAINPAGLGVYRSSEINATVDFSSVNINSNWNGNALKESKFNFICNNISYIGYLPTGDESLPAFNIGFSYHRIKDFNRDYQAAGRGMPSSLTDYIAESSYGIGSDDLRDGDRYDPYNSVHPWLSILGFQGNLIHNAVNDNDQTIDDVYTSWLGGNETVSPNLWVSERGNIVSYDFSAGANISNQFYLGLTLAVTDINYQLSSFYKETFENNDHIGLKNDFQTTGSGYQVNVGAIWRPADFLRLGIAYHSPTYYTLTDRYFGHATASYTFGDGSHSNDWAKSPEDAYTDYHFNTPYSWVFSAAGILGTKAIISADYEVKDYTNMNLMDIYQVENTIDNHTIDRDFKVASTLRAGFEYRFTPQFSGRLGYSWVENPYEKGFKNKFADPGIVGTVPHFVLEGDTHYYTAGIGYRITSQWYLDVAFVYRTQTDDLYYFPKYWIDGDDGTPFALVDSSPAKLKNTGYKGLITLGYKF